MLRKKITIHESSLLVACNTRGGKEKIPDGLSNLIGTLSAGTEVLRNSVVEKVEYGTQGVKVDYRHNDEIQSIFGDMCICTLPLGVLKDSIKNISGSPHFEPALPVNKRKAIEQLGFGTINKVIGLWFNEKQMVHLVFGMIANSIFVILFFDRSFWDHQPVFGNIGESGWSRGELYMFQAVPDRSILVGLLSGEAANLSEDYEKRTIVIRAMNILIAVFGPSCPQKVPIDAVVTNWRTDPFARGAVSYVPTEATGDLYDKLAEPVLVENEQPRILFAGEHTIRNYPASLHGAFLSGVREAARVADYFSGSPFTLTS
ncbi:unnamed protein product [Dracunculus medinensis]|uniref:Amino_oxidase domain-containing protein n=1 Tax=Dracunculus medinensis TaxID=318479 RepID=A0A0N4UEU0_DRAME|nr:unnamed protein product [Dracunculus medinensis]